MRLDLEIWNVRKCVYGGPGAPTLSAARQELARWLTGLREVGRVLFPEEATVHRPRTSSGEGRSANRIPGDR